VSGPRPGGSVANLPTTTFGHRSLVWWGTLAFVVIEGSTLFICAVSYLYLRQRVPGWPPPPVPRPSLAAPAVQVALMLLSMVPMAKADRAARRLDLAAVRAAMVVISFLAVAMCGVRALELQALHVRWDANAYGSVTWGTLVGHSTLLLLETVETLVFTLLLYSPKLEQRDISGVTDNALYWYFMTGVWIPLAAIVFLSPYLR
jgi:cytochrome c oxidase subunit 3